MSFFALKISDANAVDTVNSIKSGSDNIVIQQLNQLDNELVLGSKVFLQLGGDRVSWDKGLIGLAEIISEPFDKGYDPNNSRNFKLGLKMVLVLKHVIKREDFRFYVDAYDAGGIGPNTRGEQNQAIKALTEKQAYAILRAMAEQDTSIAEKIRTIFNKEECDAIFGKMKCMVERMMTYSESVASLRESNDFSEEDSSDISLPNKAKGGFNKIFYGAPGCGKSHYVKQLLQDAGADEKNIFRVTFHPEYTNYDFVGQILPSVEEKTDEVTGEVKEIVKYQFNPGPFTLALRRAYETNEMVYLVIEELNRGNAAAIFGDLFQLLDRIRNTEKPDYSESEYPISNPNLQDYIIKFGDKDIVVEILHRVERGIYIPGNLTILATMNSSDQNVFTLDTAFKRRWYFEQISNDIKKDANHTYKNWFVPGTDVTWERFLVAINDKILDYKIHNQTNEDKRLGKYFVTRECLTEHVENIRDVKEIAKIFAYKILEYVWNDVCKIGREEWFDTEKYRTLEELIEAFVSPEEGSTPLDVFQITF